VDNAVTAKGLQGTRARSEMTFSLSIDAISGQHNWFDLSDEERPELERAVDNFNLGAHPEGARLDISTANVDFNERYLDVYSMKIED
jgi:hypothetical protein